jgi:hypothetical protein
MNRREAIKSAIAAGLSALLPWRKVDASPADIAASAGTVGEPQYPTYPTVAMAKSACRCPKSKPFMGVVTYSRPGTDNIKPSVDVMEGNRIGFERDLMHRYVPADREGIAIGTVVEVGPDGLARPYVHYWTAVREDYHARATQTLQALVDGKGGAFGWDYERNTRLGICSSRCNDHPHNR